MYRSAKLSPDGIYRFSLQRMLKIGCNLRCCKDRGVANFQGFVLWIANNPSTADAENDDPTIRRMWDFTCSFGYRAMIVVNTNPFRATDPKEAKTPHEAALAVNDLWLRYMRERASMAICAWGDKANEELAGRTVRVLKPFGPMLSIGDPSKAGNPRHPLYLLATTRPQLWTP